MNEMPAAYEVRMVVNTSLRPAMAQRVRKAIETAGGIVERIEHRPAGDDDMEYLVSLVIGDPGRLSPIVRSVERLRGAGVAAVSEPKPLANS